MITVYTHPTCVKCKILKAKLQEYNMKYIESDNYDEIPDVRSLPMVRQSDGSFLTFEEAILKIGVLR